jgi:hypothetical protein
MKKSTSVIIIVGLILTAGIVGAILGSSISESQRKPEIDREELRKARESVGLFITIKTAVTLINITISTILILLYINIYRKIKSDFTLGLIIVMFTMLIYAITSNPLLHSVFGYGGFGLGPFTMISDLFATAALVTLLYLSLK